MVTPGHVRLDEGSDAAGYTLFDRNNERICNVSVDDRSILVLDSAQPLPALPDTRSAGQVEADTAAPLVAGRPNHVRLLANGELCGELVTIEGVMEEGRARSRGVEAGCWRVSRRPPCRRCRWT